MDKKIFIRMVIFLIMLDQVIKLIINQFFYMTNFNIIGEFVQFKPYLNDQYSWINSLFNLGINRILHTLVVILMIVLISVLFKFIKTTYTKSSALDYLFLFVISGAVCSLIDKLFWGGSLDYIMLKGLFIFDLKDVYISMFEILLVIVILLNFKSINKMSEKQLFRDFKRFIYNELKGLKIN
jgi:signal peptidase II